MAHRRSERVVWSEGMLMCPQHLQQQDAFFEASLAARVAAVAPHAWGVVSMAIDESELAGGAVRLAEFSGVLPGGLPLQFTAGEVGAPTSRPIADQFSATSTVLEVFLAVPVAHEGLPNVQDAAAEAGTARFRSHTRSVRDLTAARTEQLLVVAQPHATLRFGHEPREDFDAIKVAEVVRDQTGHFRLSGDFIAPVLKIAASAVLVATLQDLLSTVLSKQRALAAERRQVDAAAVEFAAADITRYLLLNALATAIPVLRHLVEARDASPLAAYLALVQLGGALTTFTGDVDPSSFPAFRHADLRASFGELKAVLDRMLGAAVRERCIEVPLAARPDGMWVGQLKDERLPQCSRFVLALESANAPQDTANRLPQLSKIASWKQISDIVRASTPGVPLTVTHRPPPEIPVRPKHVYFLLGTDDDFWLRIAAERTVAIYLPPPFDPANARITLLGIPERAAGA